MEPLLTSVPEDQDLFFVTGPGAILGGQYRLDRLFGSQGGDALWVATDLLSGAGGAGARNVLVKFYAEPDSYESSLDWVTRLSSVYNEHIVRVRRFGRIKSSAFMVTDAVNGERLDRWIELHPMGLPVQEASVILSAVARALTACHENGVTLGTLSPENISFNPRVGVVKLFNFNLPDEQIGADAGQRSCYASREFLQGRPPTAGDDAFSLACIAYELLSGHHPFGGIDALTAFDEHRAVARLDSIGTQRSEALLRALSLHDRGDELTLDDLAPIYTLDPAEGDPAERAAAPDATVLATGVPGGPASAPEMPEPFVTAVPPAVASVEQMAGAGANGRTLSAAPAADAVQATASMAPAEAGDSIPPALGPVQHEWPDEQQTVIAEPPANAVHVAGHPRPVAGPARHVADPPRHVADPPRPVADHARPPRPDDTLIVPRAASSGRTPGRSEHAAQGPLSPRLEHTVPFADGQSHTVPPAPATAPPSFATADYWRLDPLTQADLRLPPSMSDRPQTAPPYGPRYAPPEAPRRFDLPLVVSALVIAFGAVLLYAWIDRSAIPAQTAVQARSSQPPSAAAPQIPASRTSDQMAAAAASSQPQPSSGDSSPQAPSPQAGSAEPTLSQAVSPPPTPSQAGFLQPTPSRAGSPQASSSQRAQATVAATGPGGGAPSAGPRARAPAPSGPAAAANDAGSARGGPAAAGTRSTAADEGVDLAAAARATAQRAHDAMIDQANQETERLIRQLQAAPGENELRASRGDGSNAKND